jgi:hypothetical protein
VSSLDLQEPEIERFFSILKLIETAYPPDLLEARRSEFVRRAEEISQRLGVLPAFKNRLRSDPGKSPLSLGGIIETVLVLAIVGEAGAAAYFYRGKIAEAFRFDDPTTEVMVESSLTPEFASPVFEPAPTEEAIFTITPSPTGTPSPTVAPTEASNGSEGESLSQPNVTPAPKDDTGNHFGQTPKPERTKDNGNGKDK